MNAKKMKAALSAILVLSVFFSAIPVSAAGSTYTVSFPVTVTNPKQNIPEDTEFTLSIEGQPHAPLPVDSEITAKVNSSSTFDEIEFTEPGNYIYTVKQIPPEDKKIITDTKVYEIKVIVIRNEEGNLEGGYTISNQEGDGKPTEIAFSNDYQRTGNTGGNTEGSTEGGTKTDDPEKSSDADKDADSKKDNPPPTGEPLSPAFAGLFGSCAVLLALWATRKFHNKKADQGGID